MTVKLRKRTGFTLVEIMTTVAIIGILASMAVPAFSKYVRRSKTSEALMNLRKIYDGSVEYIARDFTSRAGSALPKQFPKSVKLTPGSRFCRDNGSTKFDPSNPEEKKDWTEATWEALSFGVSDPHYYSYQYDSTGMDKNSAFTARAVGDLNCDQSLSTFERVGTLDADLNVVGGGAIYSVNELD